MPDAPPPILAYAAPVHTPASLGPLVRLIGACTILYAAPLVLTGLFAIGNDVLRSIYNGFLIQWIAELMLLTGAILSVQAEPANRRFFLAGAWLDGGFTLLGPRLSLRMALANWPFLRISHRFIVLLGPVSQLVMPLVIILLLHRRAFRDAYRKPSQAADSPPIVSIAGDALGRSPLHFALRILAVIAAIFAGLRIIAIGIVALGPVYRFTRTQHVLTAVDFSITVAIAAGAYLCLRAASPGRITLLIGAGLYILFSLTIQVVELGMAISANRASTISLSQILQTISDMAFPLLLVLFCHRRAFRQAFTSA